MTRAGWALAGAYLLLILAWSITAPPGQAPDEYAHYIKALAAAQGDFTGSPVASNGGFVAFDRAQAAIARSMTVPARLAPPWSWWCETFNPRVSASCVEQPSPLGGEARAHATSYVGLYSPYPYVVAGWVAELGHDPSSGLRWARVPMALVAGGLIFLAVFAFLGAGRPGGLVGLQVAVSPMVLYISGSLSPSAFEVPAGLALAALVIRITRPGPIPGWTAPATAASAFLLAFGRPLGPFLLAGLLILAPLLADRDLLVSRLRERRWTWLASAVVVLLACAANLAWQALALPVHPAGFASGLANIPQAVLTLPETLGETIGVFGQLNILMPKPLYLVAGLAFVGLLGAGLLRSRLADARRLEAWLAVTMLATLAVSAFVVLPVGGAPQGRYVLPLLVSVPLLAAEVIGRTGRFPRPVAISISATTGGLQLGGWYTAAHHWAVGSAGPTWFLGAPEWTPPGGWLPWLVLVTMASGMIVLAGMDRPAPIERR